MRILISQVVWVLFVFLAYPKKVLDSPVEVWFVFVHIDVVEWILSEPGVDSKSVLVRPFGYRWQCNGL